MRISDWSSDVCSSDLGAVLRGGRIERRIAREGDAAARLGDIVQRPGEAFRRRRDLNARLAVGTVVDDDDNGLDRAALLQRRQAVQQPAEPFRQAIGGGAKRHTQDKPSTSPGTGTATWRERRWRAEKKQV